MSDGERPLLEIDRYESFIRFVYSRCFQLQVAMIYRHVHEVHASVPCSDENELTLALDKLTKSGCAGLDLSSLAAHSKLNCFVWLRGYENNSEGTGKSAELCAYPRIMLLRRVFLCTLNLYNRQLISRKHTTSLSLCLREIFATHKIMTILLICR